MKELLVLMACLFFYQALKAQTWSEWFRQNHTQLLYLQEQIAALQLYNTTQQTGYAVSEEGLVEIDSTEEADHAEHEEHFAALETASRNVLDDPRIDDIQILCERCDLIADAVSTLGLLRSSESTDWAALSEDAADAIKEAAGKITNRLYDIVLPGRMEMNDGEREQEIGRLQALAKKVYKKSADQLELMTSQPILP
jgi:hypothetical protein